MASSIKAVTQLCEQDLQKGINGDEPSSWQYDYRGNACVYIGGLDVDLSEGDVLAVVSQWGSVVDMRLVRDRTTGASRGFCFVVYEDQRSTILCVTNLNGRELLGRTLSVDHADYKPPDPPSDSEDETYVQHLARDKKERLATLLEGAQIEREERKREKKKDKADRKLQLETKRLRVQIMTAERQQREEQERLLREEEAKKQRAAALAAMERERRDAPRERTRDRHRDGDRDERSRRRDGGGADRRGDRRSGDQDRRRRRRRSTSPEDTTRGRAHYLSESDESDRRRRR